MAPSVVAWSMATSRKAAAACEAPRLEVGLGPGVLGLDPMVPGVLVAAGR